MENKISYGKTFTNGLIKENAALRLVLGCCPTLAVTTAVFNGLGMGIAATFVLVCSNLVISAIRKLIPSQVRLPCFIVIIASFVTLVHMLIKAFVPELNAALGVYLPLITVNCIILGRAEMFASKNPPVASILDGLGMGLGFTIVLVLMSAARELLGAGTLMGFQILPDAVAPISLMIQPPGGFFVFGVFMALAVFIERKLGKEPLNRTAGCEGCPVDECPSKGGEE